MFHQLYNGSHLSAAPSSSTARDGGSGARDLEPVAGVADPDKGATRLGIQFAAWRAVDDGRADAYAGIDFASLDDGELVLIAARAMSELERNVDAAR